MMHLDYKTEIWMRIPIENEEDIATVTKRIEEGYLPAELYNIEDLELGSFEILYDTERFIFVNENDGQSTIEIMKEGEVVWDNSYESEVKRKSK